MSVWNLWKANRCASTWTCPGFVFLPVLPAVQPVSKRPMSCGAGLDPVNAHGSLRFTLGKWTTEEEIDKVLETLPRIVAKLRAMSPLYKK